MRPSPAAAYTHGLQRVRASAYQGPIPSTLSPQSTRAHHPAGLKPVSEHHSPPRAAHHAPSPWRVRGPFLAASAAATAIAAGVSATEGFDTFLAAAGSVFYEIGVTTWKYPVASAVAAAMLVASVVYGESLLDRLSKHFPSPGTILMGLAVCEGIEKIAAHHGASPAGTDVAYLEGMGMLWFISFFATNTALHHLHSADHAAHHAKLHAKLLCLFDDIPALAVVLASWLG